MPGDTYNPVIKKPKVKPEATEPRHFMRLKYGVEVLKGYSRNPLTQAFKNRIPLHFSE